MIDFLSKIVYDIQAITSNLLNHARVVKLVDAVDSKSTDRDIVTVRVRPRAPGLILSLYLSAVIWLK